MRIHDDRLDALLLDACPHQLHLSPDAPKLTPARMLSPLAHMRFTHLHERKTGKPLSHLWTCDVELDDDDGVTSAWVRMMRDERTLIERRDPDASWWHYLIPRVDARVLRISTFDEYRHVQTLAGVGMVDAIPTRWLSDRVDAIRIEQRAVDRLERFAIGYACTSTGWFRWRFESSRCCMQPRATDQVIE